MVLSSLRFQRLTDTAYWFVLYFAGWGLLSGGDGWGFGLLCAMLAAWVSLALGLRPFYLRLRYLPHFLFFFLCEVAAGAWDVARRAMLPRTSLAPALVTYPLRCGHPQVRLLLSAMVGLLPGTWASHFDDRLLYLHVLDQHQDWRRQVEKMERQLARLFGADIS